MVDRHVEAARDHLFEAQSIAARAALLSIRDSAGMPYRRLEAGRVTPATVADHLVPHRGDFTAFRLGPLRRFCADCHNRLNRTNAPRAPVRADGTPSDLKHPWNAGGKARPS